ncbi:MAG: GGDEF domain-containing protein [Lachnospiraceae bacterium]|nr:GGDEF domain-containing protein [Lachnospiraceae bacterium]
MKENNIGTICHMDKTVSPGFLGHTLFEQINANPYINTVTVVDDKGGVLGILTRANLIELFGGQYGYSLHSKKTCGDLMQKKFLAIDASASVETVSKLAMERSTHQLYDDVIITQDEKYLGVVSVKDLLETAIAIKVMRAVDTNPLSGLPGNSSIDEKIKQCLSSHSKFAIAYLDLDNFKAYNDAYGFNNGDLMLKAVVQCMKECCNRKEFLGHIGGDDFVIISDYYELDQVCDLITQHFSASIKELYKKEDWENGFIRSKDRSGKEMLFPLATLSISIITNQKHDFPDMNAFSKELVILKKKSKHQTGHSIQIV